MDNDSERGPEFRVSPLYETLTNAERVLERGQISVQRTRKRIEESLFVLRLGREMRETKVVSEVHWAPTTAAAAR